MKSFKLKTVLRHVTCNDRSSTQNYKVLTTITPTFTTESFSQLSRLLSPPGSPSLAKRSSCHSSATYMSSQIDWHRPIFLHNLQSSQPRSKPLNESLMPSVSLPLKRAQNVALLRPSYIMQSISKQPSYQLLDSHF